MNFERQFLTKLLLFKNNLGKNNLCLKNKSHFPSQISFLLNTRIKNRFLKLFLKA